MTSYKILFRKSAEKELRQIPSAFLKKIVEKISFLAEAPRPYGSQLLKGDERFYRVRQGDYRIIYEVNDARQEVTVIKIGHRKEVYD